VAVLASPVSAKQEKGVLGFKRHTSNTGAANKTKCVSVGLRNLHYRERKISRLPNTVVLIYVCFEMGQTLIHLSEVVTVAMGSLF
jgi:hypothetical protein